MSILIKKILIKISLWILSKLVANYSIVCCKCQEKIDGQGDDHDNKELN